MAKQTTIDEQENTPVLGAEGASQTPVKQPTVLLEAKDPEWVQIILDSNASVLESNQAVIESLQELKDLAKRASGGSASAKEADKTTEVDFDEDADYEVAPGKTFADKDNFSLKFSEGEDVTHLGAERLKSLLSQGLIQEA
jgi:hypothetical protein